MSVGGAATIAASVFEGFQYVALGHLHRPQSVGGGNIDRERVQYAGSLLKYSKSEIDHDKSVTVIEIDAAGDITTERIALPLARDFRAIEGTLDQLISGEAQGNPDDYVYVTLSDKGPVYDAMARLRAVYPNAIHIEQKQFVPEGAMNLPDEKHRSKSVIELFESTAGAAALLRCAAITATELLTTIRTPMLTSAFISGTTTSTAIIPDEVPNVSCSSLKLSCSLRWVCSPSWSS